MPHCYATVAEFNEYLTDNGALKLAAQGGPMIALKLSVLEASSRRVDEFCERSRHGSGFGPRLGTNYYNPVCGNVLELDDDLLEITSVTTYDTPGGAGTTLTDETDFYKRRNDVYGVPPYRQLEIHEASSAVWGSATRGGGVIVGKWGERDERKTISPTVAEAVDTSETEIDVSALTDLSPGVTLLIDTEQMYVTATTDAVTDSITVARGANGTTAATHASAAAIARYLYHPEAKLATLAVASRRLRSRSAGLTPAFTGEGMGVTMHQDTEWSILKAALEKLAYRSAG